MDEIKNPKAVEEKKEEPKGYRIDGLRKMTEDILGKDVTPTPAQKQQLNEGAVLIHERNKVQAAKDPVETHQEVIDESFTRRGVEGFLKQKRVEGSVVRKKINTVTCDSIADEAAKKGEKIDEKIKVQEEIKNNVPIPSSLAPLDEALLTRERKAKSISRPAVSDREKMLRRYKKKMEEEKRKWEEVMYGDLSRRR